MELYTGVDILEIDRIKRSLENPRFLTRFFSCAEQEQYHLRRDNPSYIAGCFSAKEAFSKVLGTGIRGFSLHEISVLREESGKPCLAFDGQARNIVLESGLQFDVSISHTKELVTAFVVGYRA